MPSHGENGGSIPTPGTAMNIKGGYGFFVAQILFRASVEAKRLYTVVGYLQAYGECPGRL